MRVGEGRGKGIMSSGMGTSTFIIKWTNFLTMLLAVAVIGFGVWMSTHHDSCKRSLILPIIILGALIFVVSITGFFGTLKNISFLLWIYLILLCIILLAILVFTVLAFIVTNNGSGHTVTGLRCGYPVVNASFYDLSFHPISSIKDCKLYQNSLTMKCYNCDSCKAGVAQYMKTEWRVVAIFNVILFVVLVELYPSTFS